MIFRILEDQFAQKSKEVESRRPALHAAGAGARPARAGPHLAQSRRRRRRGQGRRHRRPRLDPTGRPARMPSRKRCRRAGEAARGATLYVTLEPCSHFGKSPPCADAVIAAGIARVVSAIEDPNPEVAGQGHARLRAAGIAVDVGLGAAEAARDHAGHFRRIRDERPHVILKLAVSADDKIARRRPQAGGDHGRGGQGARAPVARAMRRHPGRDRHRAGGRSAADLPAAGHGGALAGARGAGPRAADPRHQPAGAFGARDAALGDDFRALPRRRRPTKLGAAGAQVIRVAATATPPGSISRPCCMRWPSSGITRLMVEGGARVAASFVAADLVDDSGCCAARARSAPTASPRWTPCR